MDGTRGSSDGAGGSKSNEDPSMTGGTNSTEPEPEPVAESCGPEAILNDEGILEDGDDRGPLLHLYAELTNESSELRCFFLPDVYLGFNDLST